jgi:alpha-ketoglutarate-dependent 2,4-dichlorophenoxyacetate dioxygenase
MPSSTSLTFIPQHDTFVAEVQGVDWTQKVPPTVIEEIRDGINKYGVLVFRGANIDDSQQIEFAENFGELEAMPPLRSQYRNPKELRIFDLSNLTVNGELVTEEQNRLQVLRSKGNEIWHADMQYHPRRCLYSMLRAVEIPPKEAGGKPFFEHLID